MPSHIIHFFNFLCQVTLQTMVSANYTHYKCTDGSMHVHSSISLVDKCSGRNFQRSYC